MESPQPRDVVARYIRSLIGEHRPDQESGAWAVTEACRQLQSWRLAGLAPLPIAVNVSGQQAALDLLLHRPIACDPENSPLHQELWEAASDCMRVHGVEPGLLEFELTESTLMSDTDHSIEILRQLKQMGIRVSIDDFGTGYSSLAYLRRFPMDALKIDQSFIHDLHTDPEAKFIVLAIIDLAHRLNLKVVAEGVETVEQARFLRANGCDQAQGYWIAMPMPPGKIEELWRQNPRVDMDGISTISI